MGPRVLAKAPTSTSFQPADDHSLPAQGDWTYEDYCRLPADGWRYEVIKGVLYRTPAPSWRHQRGVLNLGFLFESFLRDRPLGEVNIAPLDVLLPGGMGAPVQPDLIFIVADRTGIITETRVEGAPDLIVEFLSPSNWLDDRRTKFGIYADAGVREYWIADPAQRTVEVFVLRDGAYELLDKLGPGERVRSTLLPEFAPAIDEIFRADRKPSSSKNV